jgi:polar amino acid transport system substrate-binding protein
MGVKVNVVNATFDAILPGLAAKKYDLAMSSMTDNKEREKVVDFVTYFSAGTSFYVKAQGGPTVNTIEDICGRTVAIQKGTIQVDDAEAQNKKCQKKAKILTFTEQTAANLALSSDRAEIGMADSPVAAYQVKQTKGDFKLSGEPYGTAPYGIAIPKDSGMEKALLAGVKALMANGAYDAILKRWGLEDGAIDDPKINGAID